MLALSGRQVGTWQKFQDSTTENGREIIPPWNQEPRTKSQECTESVVGILILGSWFHGRMHSFPKECIPPSC